MRWMLIVAASLFLMFAREAIAAGADQFRPVGAFAFDRVVDAALVNDRLYVLGKGTLTVFDAGDPGSEFRKLETLTVDKEFVELAVSQDRLVLCSRLGAVELYVRSDSALTTSARFQATDSVLAATIFQGKLCLAHGYTGVSVYDIAHPDHPVVISRLMEPDYAVGVEMSPSMLYVLDRFNGVQVYDLTSGPPVYLAEISADSPVLDIAVDRDGVAICDGSAIVNYWRCNAGEGAAFDHAHDFGFPVTSLAANPLRSYRMLAGSDRGDLALCDPVAEIVVAQTRMSSPVRDVMIAQGAAAFPYAATLQTTGLVAFAAANQFNHQKQLRVGETLASVIAVPDGLIASTERGLVMFYSKDGTVLSRILIPGAPIITSLAATGDLLFGASYSDGRIQVYKRNRSGYRPAGELLTGVVIVDMCIRQLPEGKTALIVFGRERELYFEILPDGSTELRSESSAQVPTSAVAVSDRKLVSVSENGDISLGTWDRLQLPMIIANGVKQRPRDMQLLGDSILAVASPAGLDIYRPDFEFAGIEHLYTTPGIYGPFAVDYDNASNELYVADGYAGLRYLDMSNPATAGPVYSIDATEGATLVTHFGNTMYCLSSDWLKVFERTGASRGVSSIRSDITSIDAFPNPFNASTEITITLAEAAQLPVVVTLSLVNILGQIVAETDLIVSTRGVRVDLTEITGGEIRGASGVYLLRAKSAGQPVTRKLVLLK